MRILKTIALFISFCLISEISFAADVFTPFKIIPVPPVPTFLVKKPIPPAPKWCAGVKCPEAFKAGKPAIPPDGLLSSVQVATSAVQMNLMYDYDYNAIHQAFVKANAAWRMAFEKNEESYIQDMANNTEPELINPQKQKTIENAINTPSTCSKNPIGYAYNKSDTELDYIISKLEAEDRDVARGVTEDLEHAERFMAATADDTNFTTGMSFDDGEVERFIYIAASMSAFNKNPRPTNLKTSSVQDSRYLVHEAKLAAYRSVMNEPWRQYMATRLKVIPYKLLRDWMTEIYKQAAAATQDENLDENPGNQETSEGQEGTSDGNAPSNVDLNKMPSSLTHGSCVAKEWGGKVLTSQCKPGMKAGVPNPSLVQMTKNHPEIYALVQKYSAKWGVPADFVAALLGRESGGGASSKCSFAGACGVGQQKVETMEDVANGAKGIRGGPSFLVKCPGPGGMAGNPSCDPRMDPAKSVEAAVIYLKQQMARYDNDMLAAVAGYNQGPGQPGCLKRTGRMCPRKKGQMGAAIRCEMIQYTDSIMCIPATALLEGVTLKASDGYEGEPLQDEGQPVLPPLEPGQAPLQTGEHIITEEEYNRRLVMPTLTDADMISQEEMYDYLSQFFLSDAYQNLVGGLNAAGALKMRTPIRSMKYRLWDMIRRDIQLGNALDMLAELPGYQEALEEVQKVFNQTR